MEMDSSDKYPGRDSTQPGLEVDTYYQAPKPVWGGESTAPTEVAYQNCSAPERNGRKTILGLSILVFWSIIVLLIVILAAGIGGGVGAGLAARKNTCSSVNSPNTGGAAAATVTLQPTACTSSSSSGSSPSAASSTTPTTVAATVSPAPSSPCTENPGVNGTSTTPLAANGSPISLNNDDQVFRILCNTNWPGGALYGNPNVMDIMKVWTSDLTQCVALCAEYNAGLANNGGDSGFCRGVSLVVNEGEFCYLKNGTGHNDTTTSGSVGYVSALLL